MSGDGGEAEGWWERLCHCHAPHPFVAIIVGRAVAGGDGDGDGDGEIRAAQRSAAQE